MYKRTDWSDHNCETQYCFNVFNELPRKRHYEMHISITLNCGVMIGIKKNLNIENFLMNVKNTSTDPRMGCRETWGDSQPFFYWSVGKQLFFNEILSSISLMG